MTEIKLEEELESDAWTLFINAMWALMTIDRYQTRVAKTLKSNSFFNYRNIHKTSLVRKLSVIHHLN